MEQNRLLRVGYGEHVLDLIGPISPNFLLSEFDPQHNVFNPKVAEKRDDFTHAIVYRAVAQLLAPEIGDEIVEVLLGNFGQGPVADRSVELL